jgi:hypothetical protein
MKFIKIIIPFLLVININLVGNDFTKLLINQEYDGYIIKVDSLHNENEKMLLMSIYYTQYMIDYYNNQFEDSLVNIVNKVSGLNKDDKEFYFLKGAIYMNYAFYLQFKGDVFKSLNYGQKSISYLNRVDSLSDKFIDAKLGIAFYNYGIGKLFFQKRRIKKGLDLINYVANNGKYFDLLASNIEILLLYNERQYDKGIEISCKLLDEFPNSRLTLWAVVKGYRYIGQNDSLAKYLSLLTSNIESENKQNEYNLLTVYDWTIDNYLKNNRIEDAYSLIVNIKELNPKGKYIKDINALKKRILKKYNKINQ